MKSGHFPSLPNDRGRKDECMKTYFFGLFFGFSKGKEIGTNNYIKDLFKNLIFRFRRLLNFILFSKE